MQRGSTCTGCSDGQAQPLLRIGKAQCTWTGFEVAGQPYKDGTSASLDEVTGDAVATIRGYHTATTSSGDTTTAMFQGAGKMKDGKSLSAEGT